jgi:surface protein
MPPRKKVKTSNQSKVPKRIEKLLQQSFLNDEEGENIAVQDESSDFYNYIKICPEGYTTDDLPSIENNAGRAYRPEYPGLNCLLFSAVKHNDTELLRCALNDERVKNVKDRGLNYYDTIDNRDKNNGFMSCRDPCDVMIWDGEGFSGVSLVQYICEQGNLDLLKMTVNSKTSRECIDDNITYGGHRLIHIATWNGKKDIIEYLLSRDEYEVTQDEEKKYVKNSTSLVNGIPDSRTLDHINVTALHYLFMNNDNNVINEMLGSFIDAGADVNAITGPITCHASPDCEEPEETAKYPYRIGTYESINGDTRWSCVTCLHMAVARSNVEAIEFLLKSGAIQKRISVNGLVHESWKEDIDPDSDKSVYTKTGTAIFMNAHEERSIFFGFSCRVGWYPVTLAYYLYSNSTVESEKETFSQIIELFEKKYPTQFQDKWEDSSANIATLEYEYDEEEHGEEARMKEYQESKDHIQLLKLLIHKGEWNGALTVILGGVGGNNLTFGKSSSFYFLVGEVYAALGDKIMSLIFFKMTKQESFMSDADIDECIEPDDVIKPIDGNMMTNDSIRSAVYLWFFDREDAILKYGHISEWNTYYVTDMSDLFSKYIPDDFNEPLGKWNVSNVTNMARMFKGASTFNQPLDWDVSGVTNMTEMFSGATTFNQPLNKWNVSNVRNMNGMFSLSSFNQPLNGWDVSRVTTMAEMFFDSPIFNQPLEKWVVSSVTDMSDMFSQASNFNQPLGKWNVSSVENMAGMFGCMLSKSSFNQPLGKWDVSNVTDMSDMFAEANIFNQPLNKWKLGSHVNVENMFKGATSFDEKKHGFTLPK